MLSIVAPDRRQSWPGAISLTHRCRADAMHRIFNLEPPLVPMGLPVTNVKPRRVKRILVATLVLVIILVLGISTAWFWLNHVLRSSLPRLSGTLVVSGPHAEIRIERDALGVPTIRAAHRDDLAFGLGF